MNGRATDMWELTPNSGTYYHSIATFTGPALTALQLANPSLYTLNYGLDGEGRWNTLKEANGGNIDPIDGGGGVYSYSGIGNYSVGTVTANSRTPSSGGGTLA
jgi:hypothetical protein